jgi:hypothetical protein
MGPSNVSIGVEAARRSFWKDDTHTRTDAVRNVRTCRFEIFVEISIEAPEYECD